MRHEPDSLPRPLLAHELSTHWRVEVQSLEYAPVGAGSYHWVAVDDGGRRWFVTADHLSSLGTQDGDDPDAGYAGLRAAFETAAALRAGGLGFVLSPIPDVEGSVVRRVLPDWSLALYPFIEGHIAGPGPWTDAVSRAEAARLVGRLHTAPLPERAPRWDARVPHRSALHAALEDLDQPWRSGPYAERARRLLAEARQDVEALLRRYDSLAETVLSAPDAWVVTHGEPHAANFIAGPDGAMSLIDWDTVLLAPRERDLAIVVEDDATALAAYQAVAGPIKPRPEAMALFGLRWTLAEICVYVRQFRRPHQGSADDEASWQNLSQCLAE